jgi:very-short-patch-repair endonuclease
MRDEGAGQDTCERCGTALPGPLQGLFRMTNVSTRRADRISCDEEERQKMGYELRTAVRFTASGDAASSRLAQVHGERDVLADITYGHSALLWRINMGWKRRADEAELGFMLDIQRGIWARNQADQDDQGEDAANPRTQRVIPYVEDRRNVLLYEPKEYLHDGQMASLQAALKTAIQAVYQLEDRELAAEPLPSDADGERRLLLFYEAAEGGAGVLRQLIDDPTALPRVAEKALELCHFSPEGEDRLKAAHAHETCEAACYDCLMSYMNQRDHTMLNRHAILDTLLGLAGARIEVSATARPRAEHLAQLREQCDSQLERSFLDLLEEHDLRLPDRAQAYIESCHTRPDFVYESHHCLVYVDGPVHEYRDRAERDREQNRALGNEGYTVLRFSSNDDWPRLLAEHSDIFGDLR